MVDALSPDLPRTERLFHELYNFMGEKALADHLGLGVRTVIDIQHGRCALPPVHAERVAALAIHHAEDLRTLSDPGLGEPELPSVSVIQPEAPVSDVPRSPSPPQAGVPAAVPSAPPFPGPVDDGFGLDDDLAEEWHARRRAAPPAPARSPQPRLGASPDSARDGVVEAPPAPVVSSAVPALSPSEERRRQSMRNARALAVMTQFRIGMSYPEQLAALGLVTQIELALISHFREAVPDPSKHWDAHRVDEEIQRRLARLRWVESEQEREHSGFRGVWNWLMGRGRVTGRELYARMVDEADAMLLAEEERRPATQMDEVMQYAGRDTYV